MQTGVTGAHHIVAKAVVDEVELTVGSKFGESSSEVVARCPFPPFSISSYYWRNQKEWLEA